MIPVPQSTPEKPLTAIDYCAAVSEARTTAEVDEFRKGVPVVILNDERFARACAETLVRIKAQKAVA